MARPRQGRIALVAAVAALLAGCSAGAPTSTVAPGGTTGDIALQRQLVADVSGAGAVPHLEALQRIADQNGGNRASPGPGYDASVEYVVGVLREAGYDVSAPAFRFEDEETGQQVTMRNVIAQTRTGGADHVVMVGAHLDSVPEGPGINDNGSGVAALLETATRLGGSPRLVNAVRFAFWGAEEVDLVGSTEYVASLSAADRNRILLYLNVDMVGSPNAGYFVQGGVGDEPEQTGPPGSAEVARVLTEQLANAGVVAETTTFEDDSDFTAFVEAGIASGGVLTGDSQQKGPRQADRWGGQADQVFDRCYHLACDRIENVNPTALDRFTDAIAGTVAHFATRPGPLPAS